ncbi:MAG: hypothetical protein RLZZ153_1667 [Pseudomonadota bacterium]|jgi:hypothetical protein
MSPANELSTEQALQRLLGIEQRCLYGHEAASSKTATAPFELSRSRMSIS